MKKLPIIAIALMSSSYSLAGDAPSSNIGNPISMNISGEVYLEGIAIDGKCLNEASAADLFANELDDTNAGTITANLETIGFATGSSIDDVASMGFAQNYCGSDNVNETVPHFEFGKELTIDVAGKLANGLDINFKETLDLTDTDKNQDAFELSLGGAFGTILFQDNTSAVDKMLTGKTGSGAKTAFDGVTLTNHSYTVSDGHTTTTSGSEGGMNIIYFTPSFGGLDLAFGYNQNTDGNGLSNSEFQDTFSVGFGYDTYIGDVVISLGGGVEKALSGDDTSANCLTADLATADAATDSGDFYKGLYGSSKCGDETLTALGADFSVGEYTLSSAYSFLNTTDGGDTNVWSVGVGRSYNDVDYTIGYSQETLDYARDKVNGDKVQDKSKIMMLEAVKPLGEGVDLGLNISNTEIDRASEELGNGEQDAWRAGVSVTLGF